MATTKRRLNISLPAEAETEALIFSLARRDKVPAATKARELLEQSLALIEDEVLTTLAEERLQSASKKRLTHTAVWGK